MARIEPLRALHYDLASVGSLDAVAAPPYDVIDGPLRTELAERRDADLARGFSDHGPHRDDVALLHGGRPIRVYGSQGQQRTVALSIKLAEIELIRDLTEEPPVCLLDDVMSELDERRRSHIFDVTMGTCQTLLTCTDTAALPPEILRQAEVLEIHAGAIRWPGTGHA